MRRDPTEWRERVRLWKETGELQYEAGKKKELPKYEDGKPAYKYVQAGADNSWSRITNDSNGDVFANLVVTPSKVKLNADRLYHSEPINSPANIKARSISIPRSIHQEPGLEITSPEFDALSLGSGVLKELKRINSFKQVIKEFTGDKDRLKYNLLDWRGRKKGYITAHTYDNTPEIGFVKSDIPGGSRALYDAVIKDVTDKGMPGLYTGKDLQSAPKTYSVWKHYKDKILVGNNGQHSNMRMPGVSGNLKWSGDYNKMIQNWQNNIFDGTNTGAIYLLKTPSQKVMNSPYRPSIDNIATTIGNPLFGHLFTKYAE